MQSQNSGYLNPGDPYGVADPSLSDPSLYQASAQNYAGGSGSFNEQGAVATPTAPGLIARGDPAANAQTPAAPAASNASSPYDWLSSALNGGQYAGPQAAITAMNGMANPGYNGYAAYYAGNNTVGVPAGASTGQYGGYFAQNPATGQWGFVPHTAAETSATGLGALPPTVNPFTQQIRAMLLQRLGRDLSAVDPTAPQIAQPYQAASLASQRAQEANRKANAEAAYAEAARGGGSINPEGLTQKNQQFAERQATGLSGLLGSLTANEVNARRTDLNAALQQALASGDQETAAAIQEALLTQQNSQFNSGLGYNYANLQANMNQQALLAALGY